MVSSVSARNPKPSTPEPSESRGPAQVSTGNLERVRRIKNRLVRLTTRVQTLREMLEKLMDDDSDMHAMHLTARAYDQLERQVSLSPCAPTGVAPAMHLSCNVILCALHADHCRALTRTLLMSSRAAPLQLEYLVQAALTGSG